MRRLAGKAGSRERKHVAAAIREECDLLLVSIRTTKSLVFQITAAWVSFFFLDQSTCKPSHQKAPVTPLDSHFSLSHVCYYCAYGRLCRQTISIWLPKFPASTKHMHGYKSLTSDLPIKQKCAHDTGIQYQERLLEEVFKSMQRLFQHPPAASKA